MRSSEYYKEKWSKRHIASRDKALILTVFSRFSVVGLPDSSQPHVL